MKPISVAPFVALHYSRSKGGSQMNAELTQNGAASIILLVVCLVLLLIIANTKMDYSKNARFWFFAAAVLCFLTGIMLAVI